MNLFFGLVTAFAQAHFNLVIPVSIEQTQALELGDIYSVQNGICKVTQNGRTGSACSESNASLGKLIVLGNVGQHVQIKVLSSANSAVTFTPILSNGKQALTMSLSDASTEIYVGGEVTISSTHISEENLGQMSVQYLIEVNYQ